MSAETALRRAHEHGVRLGVDGSDLILEATREPPSEVMDNLRRHKAEIVALLTTSEEDWSAAEWRSFYDKRADIAEFDARLPRAEAEANAFESCVAEWINRNPAPSKHGRCAWCGAFEMEGCSVIVPFGPNGPAKAGSHTWLHHQCWSPWRHVRRVRAIEALRGIGIKRQP